MNKFRLNDTVKAIMGTEEGDGCKTCKFYSVKYGRCTFYLTKRAVCELYERIPGMEPMGSKGKFNRR